MSPAPYPRLKLSTSFHPLHQLLLLSLPEISGVANMNFCCPVLATVLAWEMSGGSPTSATETEEVSDSIVNMKANLLGCTECMIHAWVVKHKLFCKGMVTFTVFQYNSVILIGIHTMRSFAWGPKSSQSRFRSCSSWSCKFAVLSNSRLLVLKITLVWSMRHTSLRYEHWTYSPNKILLQFH